MNFALEKVIQGIHLKSFNIYNIYNYNLQLQKFIIMAVIMKVDCHFDDFLF